MQKAMTLEINGETRVLPALPNVGELVTYLGVAEDRIAVEVNHRIIKRKEWNTTALCDSDRIEIVQFVGGG